MYEELKKRLRETSEDFGQLDSVSVMLLEAADAIEKLDVFNLMWQEAAKIAHEAEPKWIPVTERLPETGEIVLVYGKRGGIYTAEHNRNGKWPGTFWKLNCKSHHCEPTHWIEKKRSRLKGERDEQRHNSQRREMGRSRTGKIQSKYNPEIRSMDK